MSRLVEQKKEDVVEAKRTRVPVHSSRGVLDLRGLDHANFFYRWVNKTVPQLVQRFLEGGYELCNADGKVLPIGDKKVDSSAGFGSAHTVTGKDGVTLVLMALPMELYLQDQKEKRDRVREIEEGRLRDLKAMSDPKRGNYGHIGQFGTATDPGTEHPMIPKIRKI